MVNSLLDRLLRMPELEYSPFISTYNLSLTGNMSPILPIPFQTHVIDDSVWPLRKNQLRGSYKRPSKLLRAIASDRPLCLLHCFLQQKR
jgi:hypothetical protein